MFNLAQSICRPGNERRRNEDITGWGNRYFFVMDGASCLSGINIVDGNSDAAWMVTRIQAALCQHLDAEDPRPTKEILREIVADVRTEYLSAVTASGLPQPDDSPSAGIALFRQRGNRLEFFGLGDCVGTAVNPDGSIFCSTDTNLPELDNAVLKNMEDIHRKTGMALTETIRLCRNQLLENRKLRNNPNGYWILDLLSDSGLDNAREFSWELTRPTAAGGFSDGFSQLVDPFGIYADYSDLFTAMQKTDLEVMFQSLCRAQDADPDCNTFPRFKLRDDTCAMWGIFQPD